MNENNRRMQGVLRVLILSQNYWPEDFRINDVAKTLAEKNIDIEVLTGKPNYPQGKFFNGYHWWGCQHEMHQGISIQRVPLLARGRGGVRLVLNYLSFIIFGLLFAPWLMRGKKFDVIFVPGLSPVLQALPAIFLGWLKGCPVVLWVQDLWPESLSATGYVKNKFILTSVERVVRFIYRHVDLLLVQSEAFIAPVSALASGTPVKYYPNSVDASFSEPTTVAIPDVPGLGQAFSIMFAGNIGTAQAVEVIVEAATLLKDHSDIEFVVLGDGSRRDWMLQEAKNRNLSNLHMPGRFPVETMPGFMQKASVLLVTLADQEIFAATVPNKIQAYMAAGRPIIACLRGEGSRLVVEAKAGLAVPAEDATALADAVLKLHGMSVMEREQMGRQGQAYFQAHFNHERLVEQLMDHFRNVSQERENIE
jgi:glycosyltransferase involved in cell wall biosynthesis